MYKFLSIALVFVLAGCTMNSDNSVQNSPAEKGNTQSENTLIATTGSIVSLNYTLHSDAADGKIEETTIETIAQANNLYKTGATYKPFQVALGQGQVIPGFEAGLMGVKKGDKKIIKVIPSEGYGRPMTIPKEQIAPEFTLTRDKKLFENTVKQTIEKAQFPDEMQEAVKNAKVGSTLTGGNNMTAKVIEVTPTSLTLAIENTNNPFYKKELKVGASATTPTADFKITAIKDDMVTLKIVNKESPFYNKKFVAGESVTPPNGSKITIKEITDDNVTVLSDHPFMNKDLYFDVEIVEVQ